MIALLGAAAPGLWLDAQTNAADNTAKRLTMDEMGVDAARQREARGQAA